MPPPGEKSDRAPPNAPRWMSIARILALLAVIAITILVFGIRDRAEQFIAYGYPGIFIISILANATVLLPAPGLAIVFAMAGVFPPVGVALAAGAGAAIGELSGYLAGFSGQAVIENAARYQRLTRWMESNRRAAYLAVLFLAIVPNPFFDLAGMAAGALRLPIGPFLVWVFLGKTLKNLVIAWAGASSIDWLLAVFGL